jgi:2-C-methyl-D-erythritol 4-phosphate cytidylyltransferase
MNRNIAAVLAAGRGSRMENSCPKQFLTVRGKSILEHSLDAFEQNRDIDEILLVCPADMVSVIPVNLYTKLTKIITGGTERYLSSWRAIQAIENEDDNILIHDAVRPWVSQRIINDCVKALKSYQAVNLAIPAVDTLIQVDENRKLLSIPNRKSMMHVQTPQCFRVKIIKRAYQLALQDVDFENTDDCGVVHKYMPEIPILVVEGERSNIKITYPDDLK